MWNPLWNKDEKRPRALWRLAVFLILLAASSFVAGTAARLGVSLLNSAGFRSLGSIPQLLGIILMTLAFLGALWLAGFLVDRRRFADFGFHLSRAWWLDFGFGLALGATLMGLIFLAELSFGWVSVEGFLRSGNQSFLAGILGALVVYICVGIYEEIITRGYLLRVLAEGFSFKPIGSRRSLIIAFILSSLVFGLLHLGNPNATWISTANIALAGFLLGIGFVLTGELAIPIGLHISWNFFQGNVFGFPVSGTKAGATIIAVNQGGPDLLTGGAFGPEAGLIGLAAMALGFYLTILWVRRRRGSAALKLDLAVYPSKRE